MLQKYRAISGYLENRITFDTRRWIPIMVSVIGIIDTVLFWVWDKIACQQKVFYTAVRVTKYLHTKHYKLLVILQYMQDKYLIEHNLAAWKTLLL